MCIFEIIIPSENSFTQLKSYSVVSINLTVIMIAINGTYVKFIILSPFYGSISDFYDFAIP